MLGYFAEVCALVYDASSCMRTDMLTGSNWIPADSFVTTYVLHIPPLIFTD